ncbi:hypothetical protein NKR23_g7269 [Pleurostoma richardsiae]|uniref:Zn(2)-C6 fungal-type domain-containing protein n=1 Tax=Pleurostoma richardsiae TaxID=41990 RepID=A0AA38VH12_9PEZI|nr:hypothetical protein NKR23_g7269 [Pleurostoma richardsiae]
MPSQGAPSPVRAVKQARGPHRRSRIPLSCDPCRTRKLKCNREQPCQNCMTRGEQATCKFRGPKNGVTPITLADTNGDAMRQRIDHLEDLVKRLIAERREISSPSEHVVYTPESSNSKAELHQTVVESDAPDAAGAMETMMDGIHSVYLGGDDCFRPPPSHMVDGSSLLFSQVKPIERIEILSSLPPKPEVGRMISHFFDRQAFPIAVPPILHEPTFMREFNEHWRDPSQTNFIWLGLLFSILGITMLAYHQYGEPPEYEGISESLFQLYRMRTAQCLLSGDIAKCLPYTVETLRLNATAELNRKDDNRRGLWIMTGVVVRAAINMGYHRDPSHSPGISALKAEYRRRIWLSVISMDDMASFLGGFPRMMPAIHSDTMEPRNLYDWELSEDTAILPPSRPLTESTPVTYLIVKGRLFRALGRVADLNSSPSLGPYEIVLEIDHAVYRAYEDFPPHMKAPPSGDNGDPIRTTANFSNLSLLGMYHKGMCILHRRFMAKGSVDSRFKFSRDRCVSSALALLASQQGLEPSFYELSQTRQMLTLAAMVLFLELELRRKAPNTEAIPDSALLLQALEKSCAYLAEGMDSCDEAQRVHQFLVGMLSSFHTGAETATGAAQTVSPQTPSELSGIRLDFDAPNGIYSFDKDLSSTEFDWATWDAFIEESSFDTGPIY